VHLAARDVTMVMVSQAPLAKIEAFKKRMGWRFSWVSSYGSDFNPDFHVSFTQDEMAQDKVNQALLAGDGVAIVHDLLMQIGGGVLVNTHRYCEVAAKIRGQPAALFNRRQSQEASPTS
jgi:hypothetical protein